MPKSLKEQNNWKIWLVVAFNVVFFWSCMKANAIRSNDISGLASNVATLLPAGLAGIVATVLNSLISADMKARIVFWRWHHALPGNRAFSQYAERDPRVNVDRLKAQLKAPLPIAPAEQNATWYKIYKSVEKQPSVNDAHRTFLFLRDYASLSLLFLVFFGSAGWVVIGDREVAAINSLGLTCQFFIVCLSARNAGVRMVTNVLAIKTAVR